MRKAVVLIFCLVLALSMFVLASEKKAAGDKAASMKGWVSDEMCGAKGASAGHAACAKKCADAGQKMVFVDDKDHKVMNVANQDALKGHAGDHVQLTATKTADGALQVGDVKVLAQNDASKAAASDEHNH
jgi:hypothetical protein